MRRSVKYGVYGAVLAGLVGGATAFATSASATPVTLVIDGRTKQVHTSAADVSGALKSAGYKIGPHDIVAPAARSKVHDHTKIVLNRGRLLHLNVDGKPVNVWTTARTVAQALTQLGYGQGDFVSVSRSRRLPLSATAIALRAPKTVTVVHDHRTDHANTTDPTVADVLRDLDITVGPRDRLSPAATTMITAGLRIRLQRVVVKSVVKHVRIAYGVQQKNDSSMYTGRTQVVTAGKSGAQDITYRMTYVDGKLSARARVRKVVVSHPRTQVEKVGTKKKPKPKVKVSSAPPPTGGGGGLNWDGVAACESGGNWHDNTGNGYFGGLQFDIGTWDANGGGAYASRPDLASKAQQISVATALYRKAGSSPWPVCGSHL